MRRTIIGVVLVALLLALIGLYVTRCGSEGSGVPERSTEVTEETTAAPESTVEVTREALPDSGGKVK